MWRRFLFYFYSFHRVLRLMTTDVLLFLGGLAIADCVVSITRRMVAYHSFSLAHVSCSRPHNQSTHLYKHHIHVALIILQPFIRASLACRSNRHPSPTHQLTNSPTHQLTNSPTHLLLLPNSASPPKPVVPYPITFYTVHPKYPYTSFASITTKKLFISYWPLWDLIEGVYFSTVI
ncbi:hypothetical protein QBC43DRAFT_74776 [Cladorrhinum sp. PSN259]|nr:hypothetical protein QBC43DRAFT_74776 [Cladorrhinum sp. PSN259]